MSDLDSNDKNDQLLFRILEAARRVHETLGPGFIEISMAGLCQLN